MVFDLAITPDRGYCMSVRGLAREIACAYDLDFVDPADVPALPREAEAWPLTVQPETGVRRFALRPVTGIDPTAVSPWWLQRRLLLSGIRAISPAVDATNYVMLELGHPMHAHDLNRITGGLAVRFARPGETVETLDDIERRLNPADVLIVDEVATAAIGWRDGVGQHRDARRLHRCAAGGRGVGSGCGLADRAAAAPAQRSRPPLRAGGRPGHFRCGAGPLRLVARRHRRRRGLGRSSPTGGATRRGDDWSLPPIRLAADLPDRTAGVSYRTGTTARRLTQIGAAVSDAGDSLTVTPPSWRPDLLQPADLVEEVLRLEGLDVIPSVLPSAPAGRGLSATQRRRRAIGKSLALSGYVEILPTPFLPAGVFDAWGLPADDPRRNTTQVLNPLEADRPHLATTLLPGLLEALSRNVSRGIVDVALFAVAQVVQPTEQTKGVELIPVDRRPTDDEIAVLDASLPRQPQHVAAVLTGLREPRGPWGDGRRAEAADAFEAVRIIARASGIEVTLRAAQYLPWHPGRCAEVLVGETVVGHAGQLHPAVIERSGLPKGTCAVELNLDALPIVDALPAPRVSPFPAVFQDVSLVVDADVAAQTVEDAVRAGAGELLEDVRLFDVYTGPQVGENRKSLTFALRFRAADRTLTEDEASAARDAAVRRAADQVGAVLRG